MKTTDVDPGRDINMEAVTIRDIYAGKPDAKDEINTDGLQDFVKSYILPYNFDLARLVDGNFYFFTGYKGTGKTALLFYLDDYIAKRESAACSSFIFFKEEFSELKKQELETLAKRLLSSITIEQDVLLEGNDYEYIWRWLLLKRIYEDNEEYNRQIFKDDESWAEFERAIRRIKSPADKRRFKIPPKLKLAAIPSTAMPFSAEFELDFKEYKTPDAYKQFMRIIDDAEEALKKTSRTETPYYIFIDELEAFFGDELVFKRDLRLIRDLIFTVKRINIILAADKNARTKIICAVRTEVINAINRFIVTKELNKVTSGFEIPLIWDYNNTNSFAHPIIKILLKRIEMAENQQGIDSGADREIYQRWFPENINRFEPARYILNNGWNKPRDIVRLITSAQNCIRSGSTAFSQAVFDSCQKRYSMDSLIEIKEELRALYSPEQVSDIINCLTGFQMIFSMDELEERVARYYEGTIWQQKHRQVLSDLYRLGIIGNFSELSKSYRWQHKGDDEFFWSDEWRMVIHPALQSALSVSRRYDRERFRRKAPLPSETVDVVVSKIVPGFLLVEFEYGGSALRGSVHVSQLSHGYVPDITEFARPGDSFKAKVIGYDRIHGNWKLTFKI